MNFFHNFFLTFSGYDRRLPGFERYSVLGTDDNGMFNLQIVNATLEDDAIFECQVGPSLNNRPIRASARVNVMRKSIQTSKKGVRNPSMDISRFFWGGLLIKLQYYKSLHELKDPEFGT